MSRFAVAISVRVVCAMSLLLAAASGAQALEFKDLAGWWSAELTYRDVGNADLVGNIDRPTHGGESSRVLLHFVEDDGKQSARLSLLAIGAYDVPLGTASIKDSVVEMGSLEFPLTYDAAKQTLSGHLPAAVVPVYRIPVEFRRSDAVSKPALPTWDHPRPKLQWRVQVGAAVWAGLERDAQTQLLFVGTDAGTLHAIDASGATRWKFETGEAIKARPAVIGDAVFVASDSGYLYKLNKRSGAERWRAKIDAGSPERLPVNHPETRWDRYGSSIVADNERVYVGSRDAHLYALDVATGQQQWRASGEDLITATPVLYRDLVLFASFDGSVQALRSKDGTPRWRYESQQPISGDLAVDGDRVFAGSRSYDLIALDARSGTELWKHYYWFSWIESPPVVRDGVVYTGSSDATGVYAIETKTGARRWKAQLPGYAWARTAVDDEIVLAATVGQGPHPGLREGSLVALDRASGTIRWIHLEPPPPEIVEKKTDWGFAASPLLADGVAYAADLNGNVYAIEAR